MTRPAPVLRVRVVKDDCSPLHAIKCADACSSCSLTFGAQRTVCWLGSAFTRERAIRMAMDRNWQVVK